MTRIRAGFTLVELLVTITVIMILAGAMISALYGAVEAARVTRARQLVTKTSEHVLARYDAYQTQRLPIYSTTTTGSRIPFATKRLRALRELIQMEMPDRYTDLELVPAFYRDKNEKPIKSVLQEVYKKRVKRATKTADDDDIDYAKIAETNESAECLYLIMTAGASERNVLSVAHSESDVADTDFDGMLEFVDGWGQPLAWCRWPAGIVSDLQPLYFKDGGYTRDPIRNHDAFDPYRVDSDRDSNGNPTGNDIKPSVPTLEEPRKQPDERGYNLVPLVMSAGPNGSFGMRGFEDATTEDFSGVTERGADVPSSGGASGFSDPYMRYEPKAGGSGKLFLGEVVNSTAFDNIMNHNITSGVLTWVKGEQ